LLIGNLKNEIIKYTVTLIIASIFNQVLAAPIPNGEIDKYVNRRPVKEYFVVDMYLETDVLTYDKSLSRAFFDVNLYDEEDSNSLYRAFKIWQRHFKR